MSVSAAIIAGAVVTAPSALAVAHGENTPAGQAPWMATLALPGDRPLQERAHCGGTLIAPDRVLTAGHCVDGKLPGDVEVHIGADTLSGSEGKTEAVRGWYRHPEYRPINTAESQWASNDAAVVVLDQPVRDVRPVEIADAGEVTAAVRRGDTATVYGHGKSEQSDPVKPGMTDLLQHAELRLLPPERCAPIVPDAVAGSGFCTTGVTPAPTAPTPNICLGDSGGPLILSTPAGPRIAGILSAETTSGCDGDPQKQGVFVNAGEWRDDALRPDPELAPTGMVELTGEPVAGRKLELSVTGVTPKDAEIHYSWYEEKTDETGFTYYMPIEGATGPTFTVPERLVGTSLQYGVRMSGPAGEAMILESAGPVRR